MAICLRALDPAGYRAHALHDAARNWPETNCYVDLWIEILHVLGFDPYPALAFTVLQDFEGDQFTFFKFPPEDLAALYGLRVQELAIYDSVERHTLEQLQRGRLVLIEVDSYYLPDTRGTSYRTTHGKTTIGVNLLDPSGRRLHYFHNAGYFSLEGEDYDGVFRELPPQQFPYVEFVKIDPRATPASLLAQSLQLLRAHLQHRPAVNPLRQYRERFASHGTVLAERPLDYFHLYAFNVLRQLGANFELLSSYLDWLGAQGEPSLEAARRASLGIAVHAKTLQFQLARAVTRKRFDTFDTALRAMEPLYDTVIGELIARYDPMRSAS
ncbi:MAG TPA: DUF1839 family protein [Povalibacter sp.]|uniref:DUF1839 family protein n=1 Tax=Povalibacter sp. TaxID=1962978 RepID=UPI002C4960BE|nr:DUF1839 family protein [Povalibacter sp.]HMN45926.1 DUF1839 family protein [Povalibacter sp.]